MGVRAPDVERPMPSGSGGRSSRGGAPLPDPETTQPEPLPARQPHHPHAPCHLVGITSLGNHHTSIVGPEYQSAPGVVAVGS